MLRWMISDINAGVGSYLRQEFVQQVAAPKPHIKTAGSDGVTRQELLHGYATIRR